MQSIVMRHHLVSGYVLITSRLAGMVLWVDITLQTPYP